jgi:hypothetical protein
MAKAVGISLQAVQCLWEKHRLQPRIQTFKRSTIRISPRRSSEKDPPIHAVVTSIDENSQIQALDRTQPGLPRLAERLSIASPPARLARRLASSRCRSRKLCGTSGVWRRVRQALRQQ